MSRPFVHLNFAVLAEGRMATDDHRLIPISCDQDWHRVHLLRESYDAVAVGARTWINDRPRLTVRREVIGREPCQQPARVVFAGGWRCQASPNSRRTFLIGRHPEQSIVHIRSFDHRLEKPLAALDGYGVRSLLVEGGATLLQSFVDQDAYDRLTIYVATSETRLARRSIARTFPWLPALSARSFGRGTLLTHDHRDLKAPAFADCMRRHETHVHELLRGRLSYLKPADSGRDGERIALLGPVALPLEVSAPMEGSPRPASTGTFSEESRLVR